ncbi:MAG: hypothetical protein KKC03_00870 [Bacteroidetes bacterium]|nr:hypothetical protein [Bacteroidota bacterium]
MWKPLLTFIVFFFCFGGVGAQETLAAGGISLKIEWIIGNQNQLIRAGAYAFGTVNVGNAGLESGAHYSVYLFTKRHGYASFNVGHQYEFFGMMGWGKNNNLLGSTVAMQPTLAIYNPEGLGGFGGIGFGFNKDFMPGELRKFNSRRGNLILRYSNSQYSFHLNFSNDLHAGLFNGEGTDLGATGSLFVGASEIRGSALRRLGIGFDVFTPQADYLKLPRNAQNSDDGWRNVWQNKKPLEALFHANLFADVRYQNQAWAWSGRLGVDSPKLGAYVQNSIHDSFGLYPRFSWPVQQKDRLYFEFSGALNATVTNDFNHLQE